jgi:hypothetical protein
MSSKRKRSGEKREEDMRRRYTAFPREIDN